MFGPAEGGRDPWVRANVGLPRGVGEWFDYSGCVAQYKSLRDPWVRANVGLPRGVG